MTEGWTMLEAIRRTVDSDLIKRWMSAERQSRKVGVHSTPVCAVVDTLSGWLISGQLVAYGRHGSPLAELERIQSSVWNTLQIADLRRRLVVGRVAEEQLHDVRILPALYDNKAGSFLDNMPVVQAFDRFVFNDPEVAKLRKLAFAHGGSPRTVGFQPRLYQAYWYSDYGTPGDDPVGFLMDGYDDPPTRVADLALRSRFIRIVSMLQEGTLVAEGTSNGHGAIVRIPRAMWLRQGSVLDLYKGDYFDRYPDSDPEDRAPPLYLGLTLRQSERGPPEKLHVKPTEHYGARQSSSRSVTKAGGKGAQGAAARELAQQGCREWIAGLMRASPHKRTHTNEQLFVTAQERWPGISERSFVMARKLAISDTAAQAWGVAGATPKSTRDNRRGN